MGSGQGEQVDGLQRALESELVDYLRNQNSKLMDELAVLKGKVQSMSAVPAESGMESSVCNWGDF
jgi:predicted HicB family RNase H-like nuclease